MGVRRLLSRSLVFAALACLTLPSAAGASLRWSAPVNLDQGNPLLAIACPSARLCVAGSARGVLVSTAPAGGPGAWHLAYTPPAPNNYSPAVYGVSCPSTSLCIAMSIGGGILTSTDPAGSSGAWHFQQSPDHSLGTGVTYCQSVSLCFAFVQGSRDLLVSTTPVARMWRKVAFKHRLDAIGCHGPHVCILSTTSAYHDMLTTARPTGPESAWHPQPRTNIADPTADRPSTIGTSFVGCLSGRLCLADYLSFNTGLTITSAPLARNGWYFVRNHRLQDHALGRNFVVSSGVCLPGRFCLIGGSNGRVYTVTGTRRFPSVQLAPRNDNLRGLSCAPTGFCAAVTSGGRLYTATG